MSTPSSKRKLVFNLLKPISLCLGVWLALSLFIFYPSIVDSFHKYLLFTKETIATSGVITEIYGESFSESDTQPGVRNSYSYSYSFQTISGKKIYSNAFADGIVPSEYKDLPYPIDIIYLKENPEINIPKEEMHQTLTNSLRTEGNVISIFSFVIALVASFEVIRRAIRKYLVESKKLIATCS